MDFKRYSTSHRGSEIEGFFFPKNMMLVDSFAKQELNEGVLISIHHAAQLSCASSPLINENHVVVGWDGMLNCDVLQNHICVQNPE